jgi:hypothetical protein
VVTYGPNHATTHHAKARDAKTRHRILENPGRYRRLLRTTAVLGIGIAVLGAQPIALLLSGVTSAPSQQALEGLAALHSATGTLGGFGYAAMFAFLTVVRPRSAPTARPPPRPTTHLPHRPSTLDDQARSRWRSPRPASAR